MNILHLTLKAKWFDMIALGVKKEEYREIKPYWTKRLVGLKYTHIYFRNGYSKNARAFLIEYKGIVEGVGNQNWGAPSEQVYILGLGDIVAGAIK